MIKEIINYNLKHNFIKIENLSINKSEKYLNDHFHKEAEFVLVISGEIKVRFRDSETTVKKGEAIFVGQKVVHSILPVSTSSDILLIQTVLGNLNEQISELDLEENLLGYILENYSIDYHIFNEPNNEFSTILNKINTELSELKPSYEAYIKAYIYELIACLKRNNVISLRLDDKKYAELKKLVPIAKYISENYKEKITLTLLSKEVTYNKYYICKLFKNILNTTFIDYLNYVRCKNAELMLFNTDKKLTEISCECGFFSTQYFNKVFKNLYNYTPAKYRNLYIYN